MTTIHRYRLAPGLIQIKMPAGATILSAHSKENAPMLWALVHDENEPTVRTFYMAATGENLDSVQPAIQGFIGTVLFVTPPPGLGRGPVTFVFHVFELLGSRA